VPTAPAAVLNVLRNEPQRPVPRLDLSGRDELSGVGAGIRPLSIYDQLATHQTCVPEPACNHNGQPVTALSNKAARCFSMKAQSLASATLPAANGMAANLNPL